VIVCDSFEQGRRLRGDRTQISRVWSVDGDLDPASIEDAKPATELQREFVSEYASLIVMR
jgi:hypothetical protein